MLRRRSWLRGKRAGSAHGGDDLEKGRSPVPHTCHTPGVSTVSSGNSRIKRSSYQRVRQSCSCSFGSPTFQAGARCQSNLAEPVDSHVGGTQDRRESPWPHLVMQGNYHSPRAPAQLAVASLGTDNGEAVLLKGVYHAGAGDDRQPPRAHAESRTSTGATIGSGASGAG